MGIISQANQSNQSSVNWAIVMSVIYVWHSLAYCSLGRNEAGISSHETLVVCLIPHSSLGSN